MNERRLVVLLLVSILCAGALLSFVLDRIGVVNIASRIKFLQPQNPEKLIDADYPSEVEKIANQKRSDELDEREEKIAQKEEKLKEMSDTLKNKRLEINALETSIEQEKETLKLLSQDLRDRDKKLRDIASKVMSMPPEKAVEMMVGWRDFDIVDVFHKMDTISEEEGTPQITPYLLTLFAPDRRAEISRKMLLPPIEPEQ